MAKSHRGLNVRAGLSVCSESGIPRVNCMRTSALANARDYNRGLPRVVRWVHTGAALVWPPISGVWAWARDERRRVWAPTALAAAVLFVMLLPLDGPVSRLM